MSFYNDHPLQRPDSIRLVHMTLHSATMNGIIELNMTTAALSEKPKYFALSYTWDSPMDESHTSFEAYETAPHYIKCSGILLQIRRNLYDALWQLRVKQEYTPLWIDAVCIDQENDEERKSQLSLMPSIYCEASCVIIWLGKHDRTTDMFAHTLGELADNEAFIIESMDLTNRVVGIYSSLTRQQKHAIASLLRRRWFTRVWTLQEVILAKNTRCLCGPYELDISAVGLLAGDFHRYVSKNLETNIPTDLSGLSFSHLGSAACISAWLGLSWPASGFGSRAFLRYPKIDDQGEVPETFKRLVALELLVHEARQRDCCKPEDKILAPLAFALHKSFTPHDQYFSSIEHKARVLLDHGIPMAKLYLEFTRFMIESMGSLDILSRLQSDHGPMELAEEPKLPSWVPPFQNAGTSSLIDDLLFTKYDAAGFLGPYTGFEQGRIPSSRPVTIIL
ncbi:hypothetical protein N7540_003240 [Penicillium herquei]|nr:hypothetical protein N7540_003240 [Penicillium herquei]